MPQIVDSDALDAQIEGVPVRAAVGDQQASLFGLRCWEPGTAKVTLGTGAFVLAQAGTAAPTPPDGILASTAWRRAGVTSYALEGFIPTAAAAVDWFARIGALPPAKELDALLPSGRPGPVCVPVFTGGRGALLGLDLATSRADLARAVIDGIVHQVADAVEAIGGLDTLRIDGGLSRSVWTAQRLADLAGVTVQRTARPDSTALGAATLAGLAAGVWDGPEAIPNISFDLVAEPVIPDREREHERERWAAARELVSRS
jgi:glycerol kinase